MRTSLDLPDDLMREARIAAIRRGLTFRELVIRALGTELRAPSAKGTPRQRVKFPIIDSGPPGTLKIGREELLQAEFEDDLRRSGLLE